MFILKKFFLVSLIIVFSFLSITFFDTVDVRALEFEFNEVEDEVEQSYHGQLGGIGEGGLGMARKWCALPNFNYDEDGGVDGWVSRNCDECHIGASWDPNKPEVNCQSCHASTPVSGATVFKAPTIETCYTCHKKDTAKRGDLFDPNHDVHTKASDPNRSCQFCHITEDHQIAKGSVIDTSEPTVTEDTVSCVNSNCHNAAPHVMAANEGEDIENPDELDEHTLKIACEACHTDTNTRPAAALLSRNWDKFKNNMPVTKKQQAGWAPQYKWYDGQGPSAEHYYMPILDYAERKSATGAKIYPFNVVSVSWFIKAEDADLDEAIPVKHVKAAGNVDPSDPDTLFIITQEDMRAYPSSGDPNYPGATLVTRDMNFNISHSIVPKEKALACDDCHGTTGRMLLDWVKLGYIEGDPRSIEENENDDDDDDDDGSSCFISALLY